MKVVVHQNNLARVLSLAEHAASKNATLPILSNILLKTEKGRLMVRATNLEIGVTSLVGAKVIEDGCIAVPGRMMADFVRALYDGQVDLSVERNTLKINAGACTTSILGFNASEYPIIPTVESSNEYTFSSDNLRRLFANVTDSIATSESRPELTGALVSFGANLVTSAATDSFRLIQRKQYFQNEHNEAVIIPRTTIAELTRILADTAGDITIRIGGNQIEFVHDDFTLVSRLIDGTYPDYQKVIPERFVSKALVRKDALENAIKVAALFVSSISDIRIDGYEKKLVLTSKNANKGQTQATVEANIKGDPFDISVNYRYLLDGLKAVNTDTVILEFTGSGSPFILRPGDENSGMLYLIMPLRK